MTNPFKIGARSYTPTNMKRPSNKPRAEIMRLAAEAIEGNGGPDFARVYYKYDCSGCDRRVLVADPNVLPTRAKCDACDAWTAIEGAGFAVQMRRAAIVPWTAVGAYWRKDYQRMPDESIATEYER